MLRAAFKPSTTPSHFLTQLLPDLHAEFGHHLLAVLDASFELALELRGREHKIWSLAVAGVDLQVAEITAEQASKLPLFISLTTDQWQSAKSYLAELMEDLEDLLEGPALRFRAKIDSALIEAALEHHFELQLRVKGSEYGEFGADLRWGSGARPIALRATVDERIIEDAICLDLRASDLRRPEFFRLEGDLGRLTEVTSLLTKLKALRG